MKFFDLFSKTKTKVEAVEVEVVNDVKKLIVEVEVDFKKEFDVARQAALTANTEIERIKADLQIALAKSRNLHQVAIDSAKAAQAAAEADIAKFKQAVEFHQSDLDSHLNQIMQAIKPDETGVVNNITESAAEVVPAPQPVAAPVAEPVVETVPELTMAQQFAAAQTNNQ
jgi:hypothetical protein